MQAGINMECTVGVCEKLGALYYLGYNDTKARMERIKSYLDS